MVKYSDKLAMIYFLIMAVACSILSETISDKA